jgi:hypothetical protein
VPIEFSHRVLRKKPKVSGHHWRITLAGIRDRPALVNLVSDAARLFNGSPDVMLVQAVRPFSFEVGLYLASAEERRRKEDGVFSFFGPQTGPLPGKGIP